MWKQPKGGKGSFPGKGKGEARRAGRSLGEEKWMLKEAGRTVLEAEIRRVKRLGKDSLHPSLSTIRTHPVNVG